MILRNETTREKCDGSEFDAEERKVEAQLRSCFITGTTSKADSNGDAINHAPY